MNKQQTTNNKQQTTNNGYGNGWAYETNWSTTINNVTYSYNYFRKFIHNIYP